METITLGDKRIGIKTRVLKEKATARLQYERRLRQRWFPFEIILSREVRKAALSSDTLFAGAMLELLWSAKLTVGKGIAQGRNELYVKHLSEYYIIPALVEALHKEPDTEICANMLDALNERVIKKNST